MPSKKKRGRNWPAGVRIEEKVRTQSSKSARSGHDLVYTQLRRLILTNEILPGDWLRQSEIAQEFGVSRTPVREAIRTLSQDGLVELMPNHGAWVLPPTVENFEEIYAMRVGIEGLAAKRVAETASEENVLFFQTLIDDLKAQLMGTDLQEYLVSEWAFRVECYKTLARPKLLDRIRGLREESERYIPLAYARDHKRIESFAFHSRFLSAIRAGDPQSAETVIQDALRWTVENAKESVVRRIEELDKQRSSILQIVYRER